MLSVKNKSIIPVSPDNCQMYPYGHKGNRKQHFCYPRFHKSLLIFFITDYIFISLYTLLSVLRLFYCKRRPASAV